jgi:hypothetical protein
VIYAENLTEFRRELVRASHVYLAAAEQFLPQIGSGEVAVHAHRANVMAASYAYALAAALQLVAQIHGPDAADEIGSAVEDMLTNGDDTDLNSDVAPVPASSPEGA